MLIGQLQLRQLHLYPNKKLSHHTFCLKSLPEMYKTTDIVDSILTADSVEMHPFLGGEVFVGGTYQLNEETRERLGSIDVYKVNGQQHASYFTLYTRIIQVTVLMCMRMLFCLF